MVGFGSTLRLARRSGWEEGYLDYETLKLWLSQIEATYEEGNENERHHSDPFFQPLSSAVASNAANANHKNKASSMNHNNNKNGKTIMTNNTTNQNSNNSNKNSNSKSNNNTANSNNIIAPRRDFRDDLFIESNSDLEYAGSEDWDLLFLHPNSCSQNNTASTPKHVRGSSLYSASSASSHHRPSMTRGGGGGGATAAVVHRQGLHSSWNDVYPMEREEHDVEKAGEEDGSDTDVTEEMNAAATAIVTGRNNHHNSSSHYHRSRPLYHHHPHSYSHHHHPQSSFLADSKDSSDAPIDAFYLEARPTTTRDGNYNDETGLGSNCAGATGDIGSSGGGEDYGEGDVQSLFYLESSSLLGVGSGSGIGFRGVGGVSTANTKRFPDYYSTTLSGQYNTSLHSQQSQPQSQPQPQPQSQLQQTELYDSYVVDSLPMTPPHETMFPAHVVHLSPTRSTTSNTSIISLPPHPRSVTSVAISSKPHMWGQQSSSYGGKIRSGRSQKNHRCCSCGGDAGCCCCCLCAAQGPVHAVLRRRRRRKFRRQARALRRERERRVPRYLRQCHQRARDIAERFLGKLRAETEKVLLFAQSRLGELADTMGSLRFPSDEYSSHQFMSGRSGKGSGSGVAGNPSSQTHHLRQRRPHTRGGSGLEYPLTDGGMHPSDSSSDDEGFSSIRRRGVRGSKHQQGFSWSSESSDSDDSSAAAAAIRLRQRSLNNRQSASEKSGRGNKRNMSGLPMYTGQSLSSLRGHKSTVVSGAQRQIAYYAEIRNNRPTFHRNEHILGEDLLFLSAIEEADGFTALGVELMHVLRYICINLIAVRKICRRHDRLLMNRMLGGYYHRLKVDHSHLHDSKTLGGLLAQASGDIYEAHPALIGQMNHYKLVGVYDKKIQKLANSRTVQVISSCLALALSEYEVARTRATALNKLNSSTGFAPSSKRRQEGDDNALERVLESDCDDDGGPPSTASTISITRLRFTVTSIFSIREASRYKLCFFDTYLSRGLATVTGNPIAGEGLDGCSRETLDLLLAYNPDSALLLDSSILYAGLMYGKWSQHSMSDVMITAIATGTIPEALPHEQTVTTYLANQIDVVKSALSIVPDRKNDNHLRVLKGHFPKQELEVKCSLADSDLSENVFFLSRISALLFMMNYFVVHATTKRLVRSAEEAPGHTATIIGCLNLAAMIATVVHACILNKDSKSRRHLLRDFKVIRRLFLFSSFFGILGNAVHACAIFKVSVQQAVLGRFLLGFSATDVLQRQVVRWCRQSHIVLETTRLVHFRVAGVILGLVIGACADAVVPAPFNAIDVDAMEAASWLLSALWLIHFGCICFQFRSMSKRIESENLDCASDSAPGEALADCDDGNSVSSSDSSDIGAPSSALLRKSSSKSDTAANAWARHYGSASHASHDGDEIDSPEVVSASSSLKFHKRKNHSRILRPMKVLMIGFKKLHMYHLGIPMTFMVHMYVTFALEALFTSTPIITSRYFGWNGSHAACLLASLMVCALPIHFVCEWISRRYEERTVVKRSLQIVAVGFFIQINWYSLLSLALRIPRLLSDTEERPPHVYDWNAGVYQFVMGAIIIFVGLISMEGANVSLLSKVSPHPRYLRSVLVQIGTLTTFLTYFSRLMADLYIVLVDISRKLINTDLVNCIALPLLLSLILVLYLIRKHFFFLM